MGVLSDSIKFFHLLTNIFQYENNDEDVDIEKLKPISDIDNIAKHFFSTDERTCLQKLEGIEKDINFFEIWTILSTAVRDNGKRGLSIIGVKSPPPPCKVIFCTPPLFTTQL